MGMKNKPLVMGAMPFWKERRTACLCDGCGLRALGDLFILKTAVAAGFCKGKWIGRFIMVTCCTASDFAC
jgi:hypothetical protein